jgi:tetratricopeptide (TPR) repeat protein
MPLVEEVQEETHTTGTEAEDLMPSPSIRRPEDESSCPNYQKKGGGTSEDAGEHKETGGEDASTNECPMTEAEKLIQEERICKANKLKAEGNELFGEHNYEAAAAKYSAAIEAAPEGHKDRAIYFNNRATCYFKLGHHEQVIQDCSAALRIDPDYAKCLLRRAQVLTEIPFVYTEVRA